MTTMEKQKPGTKVCYRDWKARSGKLHVGEVKTWGSKWVSFIDSVTGKETWAYPDDVFPLSDQNPLPEHTSQVAQPNATTLQPQQDGIEISPFTSLVPGALVYYQWKVDSSFHYGRFKKYEKFGKLVYIETIPPYKAQPQTIHIPENRVEVVKEAKGA